MRSAGSEGVVLSTSGSWAADLLFGEQLDLFKAEFGLV